MNPPPRKSAFTFALAARRTADFYVRAGQARLLCLVGATVAFAVGGSAWWVWITLSFAFLGSWQGWGLSRAVLRNETPRNPLLLWAYNSAVNGHGRYTVNVPGLVEGVSCLTLGLASAYAVSSPGAALLALAFVMTYTISVFSAFFVDNANYNPNDMPWVGFEVIRQAVGPLLVLFAVVVVLPGWSGSSLTAPALVCASGFVASVRVRETDRTFIEAEKEARETQRLAGRDDVLNQVHGISTDLDRALTYGADIREEHPEVFGYIQTAVVRLQQLTALEDPYLDEVDYPESLSRAVRRFAGAYGAWHRSDITVPRLSQFDHQLARIAVHDLVGNAGKAGAGRISMTFEPVGADEVRLRVEDDAPAFPPGTWMAPGSSLARLGRTLGQRSGSLTLEQSGDSKAVVAAWRLEEGGTGQ